MKKIIAVFDGLAYSASTAQYAIQLAKNSDAYLVGVFLDDFTYHAYQLEGQNYAQMLSERKVGEEKDKTTRNTAVGIFENSCREGGLNYSVHRDQSIATQELLHESIYADLVVIDKNEAFNNFDRTIPTGFIRDLLVNAECPVLIVPHKFKAIEKIILLYDGSPSSVYAVKMFSYLFPILKQQPTEVVSVRSASSNLHLPENRLMKEFMKRHFPDAGYQVLQGDPETVIVQHLKYRKQDELLVLGAYQRSLTSRWFKPSMADVLMKELKTPLFIAHNK